MAGRKLSLPASLLKEIGADTSAPSAHRGHHHPKKSRKEERKALRVQKRTSQRVAPSRQSRTKPSKSTFKQPTASLRVHDPNQDDDVDSDDFDMDDGTDLDSDEADDPEENIIDFEEDKSETQDLKSSKSSKRKLDQDDAEINALERKLGLKKGSKSKDDDFGDLLDGLNGTEDEDEESTAQRKRKAEADDWLAQKRRKANSAAAALSRTRGIHSDVDKNGAASSGDENLGEDSDEDLDDGLSGLDDSDFGSDIDDGDDEDLDGFTGFSDDEQPSAITVQKRENPYVAPTTNVAKYVPPSLRRKSESIDEVEAQLRRRMQGLINRLTNENMLGILKDITTLYDTFPRQSVTSGLVEIILNLVCSPERRPDGFFTMVAGFTAAAQKALGIHVSANLVQKIVEVFKEHHDRASGDHSDAGSKHLIALLAELYNMQVVGARLIFDYVRLFLGQLTELNTELLLKIVQICGPSLRRDDPHALKEIIKQIKPVDSKGVSVRTSYMIDEMKKLQSKKTRGASRNKDLAEVRTQIRKRIGTLSGSREIQPLRVGLKEIENADKHGKWWVVGASWSGNRDKDRQDSDSDDDEEPPNEADVVDDTDLLIPDLWQLAKSQGFNTGIRQQIFVALHSATDYEHAELLLKKLRLNKYQRKELPEVIVRSGEGQTEFNRYYYLVASRFCGNRELAFQFRRSLTQRFKLMGEDIDTGDADDYDPSSEQDYATRKVVNLGKFYGNLVANRNLDLDILKYRNLAALQEKTQWFVEILLITVLQEADEKALEGILGALDAELARAIQYFIRKYVRKTDLLPDKGERKLVKKKAELANSILEASLSSAKE